MAGPLRLTGGLLLLVWPAVALAVGVSLQWDYQDNPLDPADHFAVYRDNDCLGVYAVLATTPRSQQAFLDTGSVAPLLPGHQYCYLVRAVALDGEESPDSNRVTFQVPLPQAPNAPTQLRGTVVP